MNIKEFYNTLNILQSLSIDKVALQATDDGDTLVRAINDMQTIVIYSPIHEQISECNIGIGNVKAALSRLNLFNLDQVEVGFDVDGSDATTIYIKEGKRKTKFRLMGFHAINQMVPAKEPKTEDLFHVELSKDYVQYLRKALQSVQQNSAQKKETLSIEVKEDNLYLNISDGDVDGFSDESDRFEKLSDDALEQKFIWSGTAVLNVLDTAIKKQDTESVVLKGLSHGIGSVEINGMVVFIPPMS